MWPGLVNNGILNLECALPPLPLSSIPFLLSLQIPCSPVQSLYAIAVPPTLPRPDPCWAYVIGLGVNEKVQITGEPTPNFSSIFFSNFKPPSSHGLCCFFLNIGLTQTCIANDVPPLPHMGTLPMHQEDDKEMQKKVRNKVFECATVLKIEVIEYGKMGF